MLHGSLRLPKLVAIDALEHSSEDVKQQLTNAQLKREIRHLEKESLEHKATDLLMQLTGAFGSCTSSLSLPDETD